MNTRNALGEQFCHSDLDALLADGHELGSHTLNHVSCRNVGPDAFEKEVRSGKEALQRLTGCSAVNFAYPYGHVTAMAKKRLDRSMMSCRGIYSGVNGPKVDCNLLRANSLYGSLGNFHTAEDLLVKHASAQQWVVFYTHDVQSKPSEFGCTPELLESAVQCAVRLGYIVATVSTVLTRYASPAADARIH